MNIWSNIRSKAAVQRFPPVGETTLRMVSNNRENIRNVEQEWNGNVLSVASERTFYCADDF